MAAAYRMNPFMLAALGWLLTSIAMASLWAWQRIPAHVPLPVVTTGGSDATVSGEACSFDVPFGAGGWAALVAAVAILDASLGGGAWARRSAIGWMMGSWGTRLFVHEFYAPRSLRRADGRSDTRAFWSAQAVAASAFFFAMPALLVSVNPDPNLSSLEVFACGLWIIAFAGETTADRQLLRFTSNPVNAGLVYRGGLWRYPANATAVFEGTIWVAFALFAFASPWGWIACGCAVLRVYLLVARRATAFHRPIREEAASLPVDG